MSLSENKAFTLIELIVVMAIVAVLVLLAAPSFLGYTKDAKVISMEQDTKVLADAAEIYHLEEGKWPIKSTDPITLGVGGVDKVYPVDEVKVKSSIKNIKGDYEEYGLVTEGKFKGRVFHLHGIANKKGDISFGEGALVKNKYTNEEIDSLVEEGYLVVSSIHDLQAIDSGKPNTWGHGTKWSVKQVGTMKDKYVQVADIDMNRVDFEAIGNKSNSSFEGTYDGNNHIIANLNINQQDRTSIGLFSSSYNAIIRNLTLHNLSVSGYHHTGGLVGAARSNTLIENVSVSGLINSGGYYTGGITGSAVDSTIITNSSSYVAVNGVTDVGGIVGLQDKDSLVSNSYATGKNHASYYVGGIIGRQKSGDVMNSYSSSILSSISNQPGMITGVYDSGKIENTYFIGRFGEFPRRSPLGFVGHTTSTPVIKNSFHGYWSEEEQDYANGTYKDEHELKQVSTYRNWDTEMWSLSNGRYPTLKWQNQ